RLTAAGLLDDTSPGGPPAALASGSAAALDRLRPDAAALSVLHPEPGAAARLLAARRAARVQVRGAGRVGAAVAAVLSSAGVGQVDVVDGGCVEPWDVAPGGLVAEQIGERREVAARRLVRRTAPGPRPRARTGEPPPGGEPGLALVVIAPRDGLAAYAPDPAAAEPLLASGTPHLYAGVIESTGVVGPLVLPGVTPCAGCAAAARAEREPVWPRMLAQWRSGRRGAAPACDTALATVVAGLTASRALAFLNDGLPGGAAARWELALPALSWQAEHVEAHPGCECGAVGRDDAVYASAAERPHATMCG
ncbi:ThiF family adenylyltransferase, partial [Streptomyces sp. NEAU-S77]|uniref:ThiF family adenylyltransferase n=1 Tax=Streptomyces sp. NEAU-S77 TaxID=3411033 RepID=UPI003BA05B99